MCAGSLIWIHFFNLLGFLRTRLKADPLPTTKEHPVPSSTGTDFDTGLTQEERETV